MLNVVVAAYLQTASNRIQLTLLLNTTYWWSAEADLTGRVCLIVVIEASGALQYPESDGFWIAISNRHCIAFDTDRTEVHISFILEEIALLLLLLLLLLPKCIRKERMATCFDNQMGTFLVVRPPLVHNN